LYDKAHVDLSLYRLSKSAEYLHDAKATLDLNMYDTAANRSYYSIFHAVRAVLALDGKDFKKHPGVISCFQWDYIKTGVFDKKLSDILKSAFSLRTDSDYEDFYIIPKEDVVQQVAEAGEFYTEIKCYIEKHISSEND